MQVAAFYAMAGISVLSALLAVTRRNPVHSMLWLLVLFVQVAGIFLLLGAEFLAAVQVIVYAGAILVFYLFVVMLLNLADEASLPRFAPHWPLAAVAGGACAALAWLVHDAVFSPAGDAAGAFSQGSPHGIGMALFGPFLLPFEVVSLLLLVAIVGAIVLMRRKGSGS
ncbi:MAG: NADH-quinone oxidoreductase subunit J [Planctomycetes bacterium]|nr:NADH-quinone oxidoreductase subunit J [Planctomycetota bacterium]